MPNLPIVDFKKREQLDECRIWARICQRLSHEFSSIKRYVFFPDARHYQISIPLLRREHAQTNGGIGQVAVRTRFLIVGCEACDIDDAKAGSEFVAHDFGIGVKQRRIGRLRRQQMKSNRRAEFTIDEHADVDAVCNIVKVIRQNPGIVTGYRLFAKVRFIAETENCLSILT